MKENERMMINVLGHEQWPVPHLPGLSPDRCPTCAVNQCDADINEERL